MSFFHTPLFSYTCFTLSVIIAFLTGGIVTAYQLQPPPPLTFIADDIADVSVVTISGIRDSALRGSMVGNVRLVAGGKIITPDAQGKFSIADRGVLTNEIVIDVPAGMQFVASKRGKKYYPVTSAAGQNIVPANRVYFPDSVSAEKAGYVR